jgi:hypothetical protein
MARNSTAVLLLLLVCIVVHLGPAHAVVVDFAALIRKVLGATG